MYIYIYIFIIVYPMYWDPCEEFSQERSPQLITKRKSGSIPGLQSKAFTVQRCDLTSRKTTRSQITSISN